MFHRTVKSGCRIEDRRWDTADRLEACLAIDLVVSNSQSSRPGGFTPWSSRGGKRRTCRVTCIWRKRSGRCCTPGRRRRRHRTSRRRCGKPSGGLLLREGFLGARGTGTPALLRRDAVWNVCPPRSKGGNSTRPCTPPEPALDVRCQVWVRVSPMGRGREPKGFEGEGVFSPVTSIDD